MIGLALEFRRLLRQARLDPDRASAMKARRFRRFIKEAVAESPFHRARCAAAGVMWSDLREPSDLAALPVMERADIADGLAEILTTRLTDGLRQLRTSGSSGAPLTLYVTQGEQRTRQALHLRARWCAGRRMLDREAVIGSHPPGRSHGPSAFRRSVYLSALEDPDRIRDTLQAFAPDYLVAFPSTLMELGEEPGFRPCLITTGAEVLDEDVRRAIERRFGAPVRDVYGSIETGLIAFQCGIGEGYHLNADEVHIEWLPASAEGAGDVEMLLTPLFARATPLVRYRLGDVVQPLSGACACGSWLPRIAIVEGRCDDWLLRPDGRRVPPAAVRAIFRRDEIAQYRVTQMGDSTLTLEVVVKDRMPDDVVNALALLAGRPVRVEMCRTLPREQSGKRRAIRRLASAAAQHAGVA